MTSVSAPHLLIVGAGSVGKRHLKNFVGLGCRVSAIDPRPDRLQEAENTAPLEARFPTLEDALNSHHRYEGLVICSPPKFHVEAANVGLDLELPVFLEKPVSPSAASAAPLVARANTGTVPVLVGYTYRWWPALGQLRLRLQSGAIGRPLHVKCVMSAHLSDWHPWERYQDFFMASAELGGGALLDESHFIDLMLWFFGSPIAVWGKVERLSGLEIETDDNVDAVLEYPGALRIYVHLDLFGRPHEKFITITGEEGTLHWSFTPNQIREAHGWEPSWADTTFGGERNDMFVAAAQEFLQVVDRRTTPSCTLEDGYRVLEVLDAIRQSSATGERVTLQSKLNRTIRRGHRA
jgi:predicted dehydrogenase